VRSGDEAEVARLLASGLTSAVNLRDQNGMAPLHWAILGGYGAIVEILLRNDADPNLVDSNDATPLHTAEDDFGLHDIAALLRGYGGTK
jgi:ankyrin repeat protein